jgi:hypothetical protein
MTELLMLLKKFLENYTGDVFAGPLLREKDCEDLQVNVVPLLVQAVDGAAEFKVDLIFKSSHFKDPEEIHSKLYSLGEKVCQGLIEKRTTGKFELIDPVNIEFQDEHSWNYLIIKTTWKAPFTEQGGEYGQYY